MHNINGVTLDQGSLNYGRRPNPAREAISSGPQDILSIMKK